MDTGMETECWETAQTWGNKLTLHHFLTLGFMLFFNFSYLLSLQHLCSKDFGSLPTFAQEKDKENPAIQ